MRNHWSGRLGFTLAAVGSAVGLGNIWKFPYITGMNGGGAFVLVYLLAIVICGLPLLIAELLIGRESQKDVVGTFKHLSKNPFWSNIGWINFIASYVILSYYGTVAGWTFNFLLKSVSGSYLKLPAEQLTGLFGQLVGDALTQIFCFTVFLVLTVYAVLKGVKKGIEQWNRVMMPGLFIILVVMFAYAMTTKGAMEGIRFMFYPDFAKLTVEGVLEAIGHSFFTLSLAMGIIVTYGSYMDNKEVIFPMATKIAVLDTIVALVAGLALFPIVFTVGLEPAAGPGLIFKTLPQVFASLPFGHALSFLFFLLLAFAALTSMISIFEVVVAYLIDEKGMERKKASVMMGFVLFVTGLPAALSYNVLGDFTVAGMPVLDAMDNFASNYLLPIGGMLTSVFVGHILKKEIAYRQIAETDKLVIVFNVWYFIIRFITPLTVLIVFLHKIGLFN
ncbi:sodium-dependent transporter [Seleniivibrio sp.]|uniref:sodium-dependent transporter n=1 Tax=Seleniivibrio sp. TaxID=2898801 RepID=UPI0025ECCB83|nr:sodium-dependent transporter [Seleniivibrio sp.]MCD8553343.1 sodium-dependent transporter [Seleniivibrio sp.]